MSTASFDEGAHPRTGDGKFAAKPLAEATGVALDPPASSGGYVEDDEIKQLKADWDEARKVAERKSASTKAKREPDNESDNN